MLYEILRSRYLPGGVFIGVRCKLSSSSGICQYPLLASSYVKWETPASLVEMSSNVGNWKSSLSLDHFKSLRSRHRLKLPSGLSTVISKFNHSRGSSNFFMTSAFSISSSFSLLLSATRIFLGGCMTGAESLSYCMWYGGASIPNPVKTSG